MGKQVKQVIEGKDYTITWECIVNTKWKGRCIRIPIDVQAPDSPELQQLVQGFYLEKEISTRTPQDWIDIIHDRVPAGKFREWVGSIVWWDMVPDQKLESHQKSFKQAFEALVNVYCAAVDTHRIRTKLKELSMDHWQLPWLWLDGEIGPLPESCQDKGRRLRIHHDRWEHKKASQKDWDRLGKPFIYTETKLDDIDKSELIKYLHKVDFPHPNYRVNGENCIGWKKTFMNKVATRWGRNANLLKFKPGIKPL